ncbi:hypothetical protein M413DRAFT_323496 [Hebeloma cylindrosporum]|uniref:DUF6534 domain-containing protein n=1 Tax=Hebeloma cylindrosporum TaxID=76867 RepID=A0A0C2Y4E8_HEBCY|nr:hypothetical protein M413DRAFT_323496 [Hebeloma cylindrosporum h7]
MAVKVTLDNTLGAAFLGVSASCVLTGIAVLQTHLYYHTYPKDWMFQKVAVGVLMTLAGLHLIFSLHSVYHYLITNFGNMKAIQSVIWSFKLQVLINALMVLFVQGLYALRIWKLGRHISRIWPTFMGCIVAGGWSVGFILVVKSYQATSFENLDAMNGIVYATFTTATTIDVMIATTMCYYLNRSRSSFAGTNNKIIIVMRYVLISGFLTSACSLSALITFATLPHTMVFIGIDFLLPNLYFTSYLAMLNARKSLNGREASSGVTSTNGQSSGVDVSKVIHVRSGLVLRTDTGNILSVDDKMNPDGIPLSETRYTSNFSNKYDPERDAPSKHLGIAMHRTEERKYDRNERR